jgi:chromosome partitioning protein
MKTLAILSQKGGAGKTTLAINLAVAADKSTRGKAALIDLDPQASAASWGDSRESDTPPVVSAQASRLGQCLDAAREAGAKLVIIDTAPHSESASLAAARAADFVIIPCRPAILDLRAINTTIDLARLAGTPAAVVLNAVPPRGSIAEEAAAAVEGYATVLAPVRITQRAPFVHCLTLGKAIQEYEPAGKGADEIKQLYKWICKQIGM